MKLRPFALERFFARYEFKARHLLCASDCETLRVQDLLESGNLNLTTGELLKALEAGEMSPESLQSIDQLWQYVDSIYPSGRRKFKPSEFNKTLEKVMDALGKNAPEN